MSKYRIIKSIAKNSEYPYFIQEWRPESASWSFVCTNRDFRTLGEAKKTMGEWKEWDRQRTTPAEVVWEEEDESRG